MIKILLELINLKINKLLKEYENMSTKFDVLNNKVNELAVNVDNVVTQNQALKAQLADVLTDEELALLNQSIETQNQKIIAVLQ